MGMASPIYKAIKRAPKSTKMSVKHFPPNTVP